MEETVWIIVGIISVLIAMGVMAQFVLFKSEDDRVFAVQSAVDSLYRMCTSVCSMPVDAYLRTSVTIPAGAFLEASDHSICGNISGEFFCRTCPCALTDKVLLNLTSPDAARFFYAHDYNCFFLRQENDLNITCVG